MKCGSISAALLSLLLAACAAPTPREPLKSHISSETTAAQTNSADIPAPVQQTMALPKPRSGPKVETYSVVVNNVQVRDLLFALSRDAKVNVDIHPGITGVVTLNAINQTLPQLLTRIAKQVDMRFEMDGPNLSVMPDSPFLKHYKVDYVNMSRNVTGTVSANTQIATGVPGGAAGATASGTSGNTSKTEITNTSKNIFWESLEKNIKDILHETDKTFPEGSSETVTEQSNSQSATGAAALPQGGGARAALNIANALQNNPTPGSASQAVGNMVVRRSTFREAASVIINPESGTVTVRATQRQHDRIQEFVDRVVNSARRQVLIEATIVEVELGDGYQQGIEWSRFRADGSGFSVSPASISTNIGSSVQPFKLSYVNANPLNLIAAVNLLESFGTAKVLSSPRLSVMNNQTALLKVVENFVYFNVKADTTTTANVAQNTTVTTTPQSVSVGLVMTVTPQISSNDAVILNVRPSISSVSELKRDPNPVIPADIPNFVPQIRTREIESVMRVNSGEIAVLGGLMTDSVDWKTGRVPLLGQIPLVGEAFNTRNNASKKSELVIFLRPIVIKDASLNGDYSAYRSQLPGDNFFEQSVEAQPFNNLPGR
ncbi:MAG: pilus (MSHA type) biogenesis protein MshL [Dechloromonas sp.]|uniref:Pilus (MSHA type) biogenesis protein MshL n=1 Tax=Candidatus Dechloromonas phosphorivorans TaxID=2899244 RepID=A0A935JX76_9RHOO|nr:pilus (MSHA type) biogenesis protein MshL [Candidatus Dechloromonas phosphorivorans]